MPKGQRAEPCKGCGTTSTRCKRSCPTRDGAKPTAKVVATDGADLRLPADAGEARARAEKGARFLTEEELLRGMDVPTLLARRAAIDAELARRAEEAEAAIQAKTAERDALRAALRRAGSSASKAA